MIKHATALGFDGLLHLAMTIGIGAFSCAAALTIHKDGMGPCCMYSTLDALLLHHESKLMDCLT